MAKGMFVYDPAVKVVKQQSNSAHASQKARKAERQCAEQLNHKNAKYVPESKSSDNLINSDQLANIKGISSQSLSNFNQEGANNILETSSQAELQHADAEICSDQSSWKYKKFEFGHVNIDLKAIQRPLT